ncbi:hypothetical protein U1Q18_003076 [Sarracenia purpurea var. burkii]
MCPLEEPRRAKEDAQGSAKECQDDLPRSPKICLNDAHSSPSAAPRQATSSQGVPNSPAAQQTTGHAAAHSSAQPTHPACARSLCPRPAHAAPSV